MYNYSKLLRTVLFCQFPKLCTVFTVPSTVSYKYGVHKYCTAQYKCSWVLNWTEVAKWRPQKQLILSNVRRCWLAMSDNNNPFGPSQEENDLSKSKLVRAKCARMNVVRALADVVATKPFFFSSFFPSTYFSPKRGLPRKLNFGMPL